MARKNRKEITAIVLSIIAAFALWIYVTGEQNPVKTTVINNVPVQLINTESLQQSGLALMPGQNFTVNLSISGKTFDVFNVSASDFNLVADMSTTLKKGVNSILVEAKGNPPKGINIIDKGYAVKVDLDSLTEKSVPVTINVTGETKQGYGYLQPVPRPSEVLVSGAAEYVNSVTQVVGSIDINNSSANVTGSIPVRAFDSDNNAVSNVKIEPKYIDVTVPVKLSKEVPIVVKTTGRIADGKAIKNIKPEFESVIIIGDKKYLDKIKQIETTAFDISTLTATSSKSLMLNVPTNINIFTDKRSIIVDFMVENIIEKTIDVPISLSNENNIYNYYLSSNILSLTVSGPESIINSENISGVTAALDLNGYEEGTHTLTVKINLPDGLELKANTNDKVTVNIIKK